MLLPSHSHKNPLKFGKVWEACGKGGPTIRVFWGGVEISKRILHVPESSYLAVLWREAGEGHHSSSQVPQVPANR